MISNNQVLNEKTLNHLELNTEYRTGESDLVSEFYLPCLLQAHRYDRAVGYFRSTVYLLVKDGILDFAQRGGRIRVVCSPALHPEDMDAIARGYARREDLVRSRVEEEVIQVASDAHLDARITLLATLVATGSLDIKVAVRDAHAAMFHEKIGVFQDGSGNAVTFKGSANETWSGWHWNGNLESIEVFCSWKDANEQLRVSKHIEYLQRLWADQVPGVTILDFPTAARDNLCKVAKSSIDEFYDEVDPRRRVPLPHQTSALKAWLAAGSRGVFQHATGSGKTFTAILAISKHLGEGRPALVVVPSKILLDQWHAELTHELTSTPILSAGANNNTWRKPGRLEAFSSADESLGGRIILATMQTASKPEFLRRVSAGAHLLIVADEVHQTGTSQYSNLFKLDAGSRLGLSATPQRFNDATGTQAIFQYFGNVLPPIITLEDAIKAGRLVPYEYHPHVTYLTEEEDKAWSLFTERISCGIL